MSNLNQTNNSQSLNNSFSNTSHSNIKPSDVIIKEVWADNFEVEIMKISRLIEKFPYVAMDTEFPGIIHNVGKSKESNYKNIKANVDDLKLIQWGISLSDEKGNSPQECSTWQFNLKFDKSKEKYSNESIALLISHGIDFDKLAKYGLTPEAFGEFLTTSGLILNEDIKWISFHGSYDFAYLIKILTNQPLPETEAGFFDILKLFFPTFYDIRHLTRNLELSKALQRLAQDLEITRIGTQHQAGSDSLVTLKVFHKLVSYYVTSDNLKIDENVLFGLGLFYEDEANSVFSGMDGNYFGGALNSFNSSKPPQNQNYDMNYYQNQYNYQNQQFYKPSSFTYGYHAYQQGYNNPQTYNMEYNQGLNNQQQSGVNFEKKGFIN